MALCMRCRKASFSLPGTECLACQARPETITEGSMATELAECDGLLDDTIHDVFGELASAVNNKGWTGQVAYLLETKYYSVTELRDKIRELIDHE